MRMWQINPRLLCHNHLLGEHNEIHRHKHVFEKHYSITGRVTPIVQIEPLSMKIRHDELAKEMLSRGYNHKSPYTLPDLSYLPVHQVNAKVDLDYNLRDLMSRCPECKRRIEENG